MQNDTYNKKVLLYSGGMDSWLIDKLWKPDIKLFIDINTPACKVEKSLLPSDVVVLQGPDMAKFEIPSKNYLMPFRNLLLVTLAANYGDIICLGSEAGSRHLDNGNEFATKCTELLNMIGCEINPNRHIEVVTPYFGFSKEQLLTQYVQQGGTLAKAFNGSFSCYTPIDGKECGVCHSCRQKRAAFQNLGYKF